MASAAYSNISIGMADQAGRGRALLESHFDLIQKKLQHLGRRSGLPAHEAEELCSWALLKLVEDDYRVLANWQGRSSFSTYLTVVLVNLMRDYRTHVWGKWRPSAAASRRGDDAVRLERYLHRDGLSLREALDRMQREPGTSLSRKELERISSELPRRVERQWVGEEELARIAVDGGVETRIQDGERGLMASHLRTVLLPLLRNLRPEDRLLLKLHYRDGFSLATVSRLLGTPQRELYTARSRCLKRLRRSLEEAGLDAGSVETLIGRSLCDFQSGEGEEFWT
jgi:RNA polymerase sigma factor (sigma-70 family)